MTQRNYIELTGTQVTQLLWIHFVARANVVYNSIVSHCAQKHTY